MHHHHLLQKKRLSEKATRPTGSDLRVDFDPGVCGDPRFGQLHALMDGDTERRLGLATPHLLVPGLRLLPLADNRIVFHAVERLVSPDKRIEGPIL